MRKHGHVKQENGRIGCIVFVGSILATSSWMGVVSLTIINPYSLGDDEPVFDEANVRLHINHQKGTFHQGEKESCSRQPHQSSNNQIDELSASRWLELWSTPSWEWKFPMRRKTGVKEHRPATSQELVCHNSHPLYAGTETGTTLKHAKDQSHGAQAHVNVLMKRIQGLHHAWDIVIGKVSLSKLLDITQLLNNFGGSHSVISSSSPQPKQRTLPSEISCDELQVFGSSSTTSSTNEPKPQSTVLKVHRRAHAYSLLPTTSNAQEEVEYLVQQSTRDHDRPVSRPNSNGRPMNMETWHSSLYSSALSEPHIGMVLHVYNEDYPKHHMVTPAFSSENAISTNSDGGLGWDWDEKQDGVDGTDQPPHGGGMSILYELLEPVNLELGLAVVHAVDNAYTPVIASYASGPPSPSTTSIYVSSWLGRDDKVKTNANEEDDAHKNAERHDHDDGRAVHDAISDVDKSALQDNTCPPSNRWWQWWIPWWKLNGSEDHFDQYNMNENAFAGGSHGEIWRGRRLCHTTDLAPTTPGKTFSQGRSSSNRHQHETCNESEPLILKRLRIEKGYRVLEAGLREIYFGSWLAQQAENDASMFTRYVDHFFRERGDELELWIAFRDAGNSLRSFLYTGTMVGDFILYQNSELWVQLRTSISKKHNRASSNSKKRDSAVSSVSNLGYQSNRSHEDDSQDLDQNVRTSIVARQLMGNVLRQILEAANYLHSHGVVHRDIKPSNVLCQTNLDLEKFRFLISESTPQVKCVLGDFSSAYNRFTLRNLYTRGPSRLEQTDEYAPPEAIFGPSYNDSMLTPAFDSWSIGIVALELLLGTPNVFSVDQRTRVVLSHKLSKEGASAKEIEKAMYLAALSQFCIYNPSQEKGMAWPRRLGDPLYNSKMTKQSCTLNDFHQALRARDPLGWGFDTSADPLLHLIWQLLAWDPADRITAGDALRHHYFTRMDVAVTLDPSRSEEFALESMMLDPRFDFNISDGVEEFICPHCNRTFHEWQSCHKHTHARKHGKFCAYDKSALPTCLNAHSMLPAHPYSGYCDIQGRRNSFEDFHAIHLLPDQQFYAIFDGHTGNLASKYAARYLYQDLGPRIGAIIGSPNWKSTVEAIATEAFSNIHNRFLQAVRRAPHGFMSQSGTTATAALVSDDAIVIASLGDSRAVLSSIRLDVNNITSATTSVVFPVQLTKDHVASDLDERLLVESRGAYISSLNGLARVNGTLAITRSIGDADLALYLSRVPHVISKTRDEILDMCGIKGVEESILSFPCFLIIASDGLWDAVSNQEAVDLVTEVISQYNAPASWRDTGALQQAAEALTLEAYVRGSSDNIGVCVIAIV